jgi:hypothetical protein
MRVLSTGRKDASRERHVHEAILGQLINGQFATGLLLFIGNFSNSNHQRFSSHVTTDFNVND